MGTTVRDFLRTAVYDCIVAFGDALHSLALAPHYHEPSSSATDGDADEVLASTSCVKVRTDLTNRPLPCPTSSRCRPAAPAQGPEQRQLHARDPDPELAEHRQRRLPLCDAGPGPTLPPLPPPAPCPPSPLPPPAALGLLKRACLHCGAVTTAAITGHVRAVGGADRRPGRPRAAGGSEPLARVRHALGRHELDGHRQALGYVDGSAR